MRLGNLVHRKLRRIRRVTGVLWKSYKVKVVSLSLYLVPKEKQRLFILTIIIGLVCGLAAVLFHLSIQIAEDLLINRALDQSGSMIALIVIVPVAGGLICGILLRYFFPDARGSGVPQVKIAYAIRGGRLPLKDAVSKFFISVMQIGTGASLGREGPTVQICAAISSSLGRLFAVSQENQRKLIPVGTAAGIAAAFNAPIAAITFTIEEIIGDLDPSILSGVIVAAAISAAIERSILGGHPVFTLNQTYGLDNATSLIFYAGLGCVAAVVSVVFSESLLRLRTAFRRRKEIPLSLRPAVGGVVTGLLILIAYKGLGVSGIAGSGYATLSQALAGGLALQALFVLCIFKIAATVFNYSSGGAGGIFAPALFIGGMLGGMVGSLEVNILGHPGTEIGSFALVGMGAVFAGIIRAPITSVLIIFEMTGSYGLILPLMIANMTSYGISRMYRSSSIYEALLEQDGIILPDNEERTKHAFEFLRVREAFNSDIVTLSADLTVNEALEAISKFGFTLYPILDDEGICIGTVSEVRLRRTLAESGGERTVGSIAARCQRISPATYLNKAVAKMNKNRVRQLAVVSKKEGKFLGLLTMTDIVRAEAEAIMARKNLQAEQIVEIHESRAGTATRG